MKYVNLKSNYHKSLSRCTLSCFKLKLCSCNTDLTLTAGFPLFVFGIGLRAGRD